MADTRSIVDLQRLHGRRRPDERRGAIAPRARRGQKAGARQLQARPFNFEDQRPDMGGHAELLEIPVPECASRIEGGFKNSWASGFGAGHVERDRFGAGTGILTRGPRAARILQLRRADRQRATQSVLKRHAHRRQILTPVDAPRDRGQEIPVTSDAGRAGAASLLAGSSPVPKCRLSCRRSLARCFQSTSVPGEPGAGLRGNTDETGDTRFMIRSIGWVASARPSGAGR